MISRSNSFTFITNPWPAVLSEIAKFELVNIRHIACEAAWRSNLLNTFVSCDPLHTANLEVSVTKSANLWIEHHNIINICYVNVCFLFAILIFLWSNLTCKHLRREESNEVMFVNCSDLLTELTRLFFDHQYQRALIDLKEETSVEKERAKEELFNDLNMELYRQLKVCLR